jgi:hypothetical protein
MILSGHSGSGGVLAGGLWKSCHRGERKQRFRKSVSFEFEGDSENRHSEVAEIREMTWNDFEERRVLKNPDIFQFSKI